MADINAIISIGQAAQLLKLSRARVDQLLAAGTVKRTTGGKVTIAGVVQGYVTFLHEDAKNRNKTEASRALIAARTAAIELATAERCRELITMEAASAVVTELVSHFVLGLDTLPSRLSRDPGERQRIVEICDGLRRDLAAKAGEKIASLEKGTN